MASRGHDDDAASTIGHRSFTAATLPHAGNIISRRAYDAASFSRFLSYFRDFSASMPHVDITAYRLRRHAEARQDIYYHRHMRDSPGFAQRRAEQAILISGALLSFTMRIYYYRVADKILCAALMTKYGRRRRRRSQPFSPLTHQKNASARAWSISWHSLDGTATPAFHEYHYASFPRRRATVRHWSLTGALENVGFYYVKSRTRDGRL